MRESSLYHSTTKGPADSGEVSLPMGRTRVIPSCRHPKGITPATPSGQDHYAAPLPRLLSAVGRPEGFGDQEFQECWFQDQEDSADQDQRSGVVINQGQEEHGSSRSQAFAL